ncbi:hypothetical protein [Schumannella sp. 10F1B-5-1]|uniref:hypothetical protein n=1 Tax=Schumannella sp. 10F1B-5-1 TaxID=2590780 RepID=UPI001130244D|nr:hypothetical protein [Schumannella sp. 10F1B-5-1]TPW78462.1 hypothetical protein FJ658_01280 [Schumannella sp. 10F1B-5-1]
MIWFLAALAAAAGLALIFFPASARGRARGADRFARIVGLAIPPQLTGAVEASLARRSRVIGVGLVVGAVVALPVALLTPSGDDGEGLLTGRLWPAIGVFVLVVGVVSGLGSLLRRRPPIDGVRYARTTEVRLDDYVAPFELGFVRVVAALGAVGALAAGIRVALQPELLGPSIPFLAAGVVAAIALVAFEVVGRRIVAAPQPSGSPAELAWNDALRMADLRDLTIAPSMMGAFALLGAAVPFVTGGRADGPNPIGAAIMAGLFLAVIVALVICMAVMYSKGSPQTHFLRRLWPAVAVEAGRAAPQRVDARTTASGTPSTDGSVR